MNSPGSTVADLGERALIERIRTRARTAPAWVAIGIGDDAAVLEPPRNALDVLTMDALVEGIHFDRAIASAADVGFKALAVNVSDLAAMGAVPRAALLSLVLPPEMAVADIDALLDGFLGAAEQFRVALVGGNVSRSPGPMMVDVTVTGSVHRRRVLRRNAARAGDDIYVSGAVGTAAAGLAWLRENARADVSTPVRLPEAGLFPPALRYLRPEPRLRLGRLLGRNGAASACVDLSDGLADALRQIGSASGVGVAIDADAVPIDPAVREWLEHRGADALRAALSGGEDYELLWTVPKKARGRFRHVARLTGGLPLTRIGVATSGPALVVQRAGRDEPLPEGFVHF